MSDDGQTLLTVLPLIEPKPSHRWSVTASSGPPPPRPTAALRWKVWVGLGGFERILYAALCVAFMLSSR